MKQILFISLISLQAFFVQAQEKDTLLLVWKTRVDYCNGKVEENKILKERVLTKDSAIVLLNEKVATKEEETNSFKREVEALNTKVDATTSTSKLKDEHLNAVIADNDKLSRENTFLKLGSLGALFLALLIAL